MILNLVLQLFCINRQSITKTKTLMINENDQESISYQLMDLMAIYQCPRIWAEQAIDSILY